MNHDAIAVQMCRSAGLNKEQTDLLLSRLKGQLDRQGRGEPGNTLLAEFFSALDKANHLSTPSGQWSNQPRGNSTEQFKAWEEVRRLRVLLIAPQQGASNEKA